MNTVQYLNTGTNLAGQQALYFRFGASLPNTLEQLPRTQEDVISLASK
jgi:hypothetical protein